MTTYALRQRPLLATRSGLLSMPICMLGILVAPHIRLGTDFSSWVLHTLWHMTCCSVIPTNIASNLWEAHQHLCCPHNALSSSASRVLPWVPVHIQPALLAPLLPLHMQPACLAPLPLLCLFLDAAPAWRIHQRRLLILVLWVYAHRFVKA